MPPSSKTKVPKHRGSRNKIVGTQAPIRSLVAVDSSALRTKIWRQYQKALKAFDKLVGELRQFRDSDRENYRSWYEREFTGEIIEIQRLKTAVGELADWLDQIHSYANIREISAQASFEILSQAQAEGGLAKLWQELGKETEEEEQREKAKSSGSRRKNRAPDFESMFHDIFDEAVHEFDRDQRQGGKAPPHDLKRDQNIEDSLRTVYHKLAFRLHPDTNPERSPDHQRLFHLVQEAYRERNLEALEAIWKKIGTEGEGIFSWKTASISEILSRKKSVELRKSEVNSELRLARKDPAWNFAAVSQNKQLISVMKLKIQRALFGERAELIDYWTRLNESIARFEKSQRKRRKKSGQKK